MMAEAIRTNSTGGGTKGDSRSGNSASSPAVIAIMGILGTAFLLVTYYAMVAKFCGRGPARASMRRSWRAGGRRRLNEEALGLQEEAAQEQGLEQADIEAIPVVAFLKRGRSKKVSCSGSGGGPLDCAVCLNEFEEAERVRLLPSCCHAFHLQCIDEWLRSHATCPLCRTPIRLAAAAILGFPNPSSGVPISPATTPPATSPPAAPPQQTPIPAGGENESLQTDATDWPLLGDQCRKGACSTRTRTRSPKHLSHSSTYDDEDEGDTQSSRLGRRQRPQFAFARCFSYTAGGGRSSPQNLMSGAAASPACLQYPIDVGAAHHASIASTLSSPSSTHYSSTPKHSRTSTSQRILKMQRSRSYSVGSSLFSIISTRQLPAALHDQRSRTPSTATASSKLWGSSTKVSAGAAAARLPVDLTHSQQHLQNFNERAPLQQHLRQENGYFLKRSNNVMNSLTAAGNCSSDGFGDNTPVMHGIDIEHNATRNSSPDAVDDIPHDINLHGHPMEDRQPPPSRPPPPFTFQC